MYSSVKFFEPIVIAGLPLPGCAELELELELELLLLDPQAARPMASATTSSATHPLYQVRPVMRPSPSFLCRLEHRALGLDPAPPTQRTWRHVVLQQGEKTVYRECERGDEERRRDDAHKPVTGLIHDHVAESSGRAGDRGKRRGGHDVERSRPQAGEKQWQRDRKLDVPERLQAGHAHSPRG